MFKIPNVFEGIFIVDLFVLCNVFLIVKTYQKVGKNLPLIYLYFIWVCLIVDGKLLGMVLDCRRMNPEASGTNATYVSDFFVFTFVHLVYFIKRIICSII